MAHASTDLPRESAEARRLQQELERREFLLRSVLEVRRELSGIIQPRRLLEVFLLTTLGSLGSRCGLAALQQVHGEQCEVVSRGLAAADETPLTDQAVHWLDHCFSAEPPAVGRVPVIRLIQRDQLPQSCALPAATEMLAIWSIDPDTRGLVALGAKLSGKPYSPDDRGTLENLISVMLCALSQALTTLNTRQLNSDLEKNNRLLQEALDQTHAARQELDWRLFHLQALYDLTGELNRVALSPDLARVFLLQCMGVLGIGDGLVLLHDRERRTVRCERRGGSRREPLAIEFEAAEKLLYQCFDAIGRGSLEPMSVSSLPQPLPLDPPEPFGFELATAVMFVVDPTLMGLVVLGPTIDGHVLKPEEQTLFSAQVTNFLLFLKNARAFQTIEGLNVDLRQTNAELRRTITDLTAARHQIGLLEKARGRIKGLLEREADRITQASWLDVSLITAAAVVLALLFNYTSPSGIPLLPETFFRAATARIDVDSARELQLAGKAVLVDARLREFYVRSHIEGAVNVPAPLFAVIYQMKLAHLLTPERIAIVYGRNISRLHDEEVAHQLRRRDHSEVRILTGGIDRWQQQNYPVAP